MSFFTYKQDLALKELFAMIIKNNNDAKLIALVKDNELIQAVHKDGHTESIIEDVELQAENAGIDLTRDQKLAIAYKVISEYDESDYNEFISNTIHKYLKK